MEITKERLTKILIETMATIKQRSSLNGNTSTVAVEVNAELFAEISRMALAAMDSEPMAESEQLAIKNFRSAMEGIGHIRRTLEETFGGLHGTHVEPDVLAECKAICDAIYAAYRHAQPVPAVPDEMYWQDAPVEGSTRAAAYASGWNACRAAMLAAAPHDTPALNSVQSVDSVADRWIPVSERMPEDRTQVILWDAEIGEVTSGHYSHKTQTFYHCGDAIENEITHWMPTPAAPREVKP